MSSILRQIKKNAQITELKNKYGKQPARSSKCPNCKKITLFKRINNEECQCVKCNKIYKRKLKY